MSALLLSHFKAVLVSKMQCEHCGTEQDFVLDHYVKHEPNILVVQVEHKTGAPGRIQPSRTIHLDDVMLLDGALS